MAKRKAEKPTIPIIPRSSIPHNQDASSLLREVFQDVLEDAVLPDNVVDNWGAYKLDSELHKNVAKKILIAGKKSRLEMEALQIVEKKLAYNIQTSLEKEEEINKDPLKKEFRRTRKDVIFPKIDPDDVKEYGLITGEDLRPSKILQKFEINQETKLPKIKVPSVRSMIKPADSRSIPSINPSGGARKPRPMLPANEQLKTPQELKAWNDLCLRNPIKKRTLAKPKILPENFRLDKDSIIIHDYKLNVIYKKRFKLQNISGAMQRVVIPEKPDIGCFYVEPQFDPDSLRLCAGMSANFIVYFKTDLYLDSCHSYEVNGHTINLISSREPPNLTAFILRNTWPAAPAIHPSFNAMRAQALNNTVECGVCFVGEHMKAYIIFKNNGAPAKFFIMTESQWSSQEINTLHADLQLDFGDFSITPNYFELAPDEFIVTTIDFYASKEGTCIENLCILSNNITWECLNILADVITFDKYVIALDVPHMMTIRSFEESVRDDHTCEDSERSSSSISGAAPSTDLDIQEQQPPPVGLKISQMVNPPLMIMASGPRLTLEDGQRNVETTTDSVDIIDEVLFDYLLSIEKEQSLGNEKDDLDDHPGVLYFGSSLGFKQLKHTVTIENNSMMNLKYRWDTQSIDTGIYKLTKTRSHIQQLGGENIEFECEQNYLPAYGKIKCEINMRLPSRREDFYGVTLCLVIEGVPRCAVKMPEGNPNFLLLTPLPLNEEEVEEEDDEVTPVVDIQVASFDAIAFVKGINILIRPRNVFGSRPLPYKAKIKREIKLLVDTSQEGELSGCWVDNDMNKVKVYPEIFKIRPRIPKIFDVEFEVDQVRNSIENICVFIDGCYMRTIDLKINVDPPHLKFERKYLNLGLMIVGNTYQRSVIMLNMHNVAIDWEIREQYTKDLLSAEHNTITVKAKNLECGDVEIIYRVHARVPVQWQSYLILFAVHGDRKIEECRMLIYFEVVETSNCVHSDFSECSILSPTEMLYVATPKTYSVCFHNLTHTPIDLEATEIYGKHANLFDFFISPKRFTIEPKVARRVGITITPSEGGVFDEMFIAFDQCKNSKFGIGPFQKPTSTVLTVMAAVDNICVRVILPDSDGSGQPSTKTRQEYGKCEREIFWPPRNTTSFGDTSDTNESGSTYGLTPTPSSQFQSTKDQDSLDTIDTISSQETIYQESDVVVPDSCDDIDTLSADIVKYLKTLEADDQREDAPSPPTKVSSSSDFSSDTPVSDKSCTSYDSKKFENLSQYAFEICGVPLRTIYKCSIKLVNETPVKGVMQIETVNFLSKKVEPSQMDRVLQRLKYKTLEDEWEKKLGPHGIAIEFETLDGTLDLEPFGTNEIILSLYANTWGVYKEDLIIDFNNILPLRISVIVEIRGVPLEFPIGVNNIHKTTILRFGTLAYKSSFEIRRLQVRNISEIPVNVMWHIFMRHTHAEMAEQPITVLFDVYHPNDDDLQVEDAPSQGNLIITDGKCVGKSEHRIFKMFPKEMHIAPKQTLTIKIGVNASAYATSYNHTDISAYLLGYVYLPVSLAHVPKLLYRPTGHSSDPVKAKLTATLDLPVLQLEMSRGDLHICFYADQILAAGYTKQTRHLTLKNRHHVEAVVRFKMEAPFVLESCLTSTELEAHTSADGENTPWYSAVVKPSECTQLAISYEIDSEDLAKIANTLFNESSDDLTYYSKLNFSKKMFNLEKYLRIEQKGFIRQNIPITLTIHFPHLRVTEKLEYGDVYIGNVKKEICVVKNYSGCKVEFTVEEADDFRVVDKTGVIEPGREDRPSVYDLGIVFIPQMQKLSQDKVVLKTQIPGLSFRISVSGVGRYNERYCTPSYC